MLTTYHLRLQREIVKLMGLPGYLTERKERNLRPPTSVTTSSITHRFASLGRLPDLPASTSSSPTGLPSPPPPTEYASAPPARRRSIVIDFRPRSLAVPC